MYRLEYVRSAQKELARLPKKQLQAILIRIELLIKQPSPYGSVKLQGYENVHRIRLGDYRVIYSIKDDILLVLVLEVGHRKSVYRKW